MNIYVRLENLFGKYCDLLQKFKHLESMSIQAPFFNRRVLGFLATAIANKHGLEDLSVKFASKLFLEHRDEPHDPHFIKVEEKIRKLNEDAAALEGGPALPDGPRRLPGDALFDSLNCTLFSLPNLKAVSFENELDHKPIFERSSGYLENFNRNFPTKIVKS